jgi:hypothetical protein
MRLIQRLFPLLVRVHSVKLHLSDLLKGGCVLVQVSEKAFLSGLVFFVAFQGVKEARVALEQVLLKDTLELVARRMGKATVTIHLALTQATNILVALRPFKATLARNFIVVEITLVVRVILEDCDALATSLVQLPIPLILCYHAVGIGSPVVYLESVPMSHHLIALFFLLRCGV